MDLITSSTPQGAFCSARKTNMAPIEQKTHIHTRGGRMCHGVDLNPFQKPHRLKRLITFSLTIHTPENPSTPRRSIPNNPASQIFSKRTCLNLRSGTSFDVKLDERCYLGSVTTYLKRKNKEYKIKDTV